MDTASLAQTHLRSAYTDIATLPDALPDGRAGVEAAATQFESVFIDMWLQSMRAAGAVFGDGSYLSSNTTDMHQEMLDHQLAVHLAESGGIGLRDVIVAQLSPAADSGREVATQPPARAAFPRHEIAVDSRPPQVDANGFKAAGFESAEAFLDAILPVVRQALSALGFDPIGPVAQAALETGWGARVIHRSDGQPSHNLFGVKSHGWSGESVRVATLEHELGGFAERSERFRAYPSWQSAVADYVEFLQGNPRYQDAVAHADDPYRFADELQRAGYATDPNYAQKIKRLIDQLQDTVTNR